MAKNDSILIPGQGSLESMPERGPSPSFDVPRLTFAQMATPEFVRLPANLAEQVSPETIAAAEPAKLRTSLIDDGHNLRPARMDESASPFVVDYYDRVTHRRVKVALNPFEADVIMRTEDPAVLGGAGARKAVKKVAGLDKMARGHSKAQRASVEVVEQKRKAMANYIERTLRPGLDDLRAIAEKAEHPNLARKGSSGSRMDLTWVRMGHINNMLDVIGLQRAWSDDQLQQARSATDWRLFHDRAKNRHLDNWKDMLGLLVDYQSHRLNVFQDREYRARDWMGKQDLTVLE